MSAHPATVGKTQSVLFTATIRHGRKGSGVVAASVEDVVEKNEVCCACIALRASIADACRQDIGADQFIEILIRIAHKRFPGPRERKQIQTELSKDIKVALQVLRVLDFRLASSAGSVVAQGQHGQARR